MKYLKTFENKSEKTKSTILISAFPGTGKSHLFKNNKELKILDSDSSTFDKDGFPNNYIEHIKENIGKVDIICISSHKEVREALVDNDLMYILVYPNIELKEEYIKRYKERGNEQVFIDMIGEKWEEWITDVSKQEKCLKVELQKGEFLGDKFQL